MQHPSPTARSFDPERHDSHLIALFDTETSARQAASALQAAGLPESLIAIMADGDSLHRGVRHPVQDLFVPEDDYHDYHHALGRGHALLIVRPTSPAMRDAAVAVLERSAPLDIEEHGRHWRGHAGPAATMPINHANLSRADMHGRAIGGRDEVILDMTGQKMTVRMLSEADMQAAPFAPPLPPAQRPAPLAPPPPLREVPVRGTSYTYGVPAEIVQRMSPEQQVMAQPHAVQMGGDTTTRGTFLRMVDGQTRVGWRDSPAGNGRIRSYVTERTDPGS